MPYDMVQRGDEWCVVKTDADKRPIETMKCYPEKAPATAYLQALNINVVAAERALERAVSGMMDRHKEAQFVWVGISTTGMRDKLGDLIPSYLTRVDIEEQARAIRVGAARPDFKYWNRQSRSWVHESELNSPTFQDFGALLMQHDLHAIVGRRAMRLPADDYACIEAGWCSRAFKPATMSIGYRYASEDDKETYPINYLAVYSFEASVTVKGTEANPYTVFACEPSKLKRDEIVSGVWGNFRASMLGN